MNREDLISRARRGFEMAGRGLVVLLERDAKPRYVAVDEATESLVQAKVEPELLAWVFFATGKYDPKWEAVFLFEDSEGFTVQIVRPCGVELVGQLSWPDVN